jgi:hypothetical protein
MIEGTVYTSEPTTAQSALHAHVNEQHALAHARHGLSAACRCGTYDTPADPLQRTAQDEMMSHRCQL